MARKLVILLITAVLILLAVGGAVSMTHNRQAAEHSSAGESSLSEVIVVPSEMPSRISMQVPDGFTETNSPYYDKYYICGSASIIVTGEELVVYNQSLESYTANVLAQYQATAENFQMLSDTTIEVTQVDCRILEFQYTISGEDVKKDFQCITAVLIKDDYAYLVTCKSPKAEFGLYRSALLSMLRTIEISSDSPMYNLDGDSSTAESSGEPVETTP